MKLILYILTQLGREYRVITILLIQIMGLFLLSCKKEGGDFMLQTGLLTTIGGGGNVDIVKRTSVVTYDGNGNTGGSVPVDPTPYEEGQAVTILGNPGNLVKTGSGFIGWNTQADGSGITYTQSQIFTMGPANVTLYAGWPDSHEPNNVPSNPSFLGNLSHGFTVNTQMSIFPAGDTDWMKATLLDPFCPSGVQSFSGSIQMTPPTGMDYDLTVCFDYTSPLTCQTSAGSAVETVVVTWAGDCATDDRRDIYIKVNAINDASMAYYMLKVIY
jgi:hypothetical protein